MMQKIIHFCVAIIHMGNFASLCLLKWTEENNIQFAIIRCCQLFHAKFHAQSTWNFAWNNFVYFNI